MLETNNKNDAKKAHVYRNLKGTLTCASEKKLIMETVKYLELDNSGKLSMKTRQVARVVSEGKWIDLKAYIRRKG